VVLRQILPIEVGKIKETINEILPEMGKYAGQGIPKQEPEVNKTEVDYIFEPSPAETLNFLIPYLVRMQFYHLVLEANASEHSARRVAMKTASDNADDLAGNLTLKYNTARQAGITNEIIEITSTKNAIG
jgi:F-type H+-transporting ATPase subunit gamma